jgi:hypothetical protein
MKRVLLAVMMVLGAAGPSWAQSPRAYIRSVIGTVEVRAPGSAVWIPAAAGQELEQQTTVSTGFRSAAIIRLGDSTITVRPLTRLTVGELAAAAGTDQIGIELWTGRVRVNVQPPPAGKVHFTIRSSAATASVRGTVFEFDTLNLQVAEGTVDFSGMDNTVVYVSGGWSSSPDPVSGNAAVPVETSAASAAALPAGVEIIAVTPPAVISGQPPQAPAGIGIHWPD